MILTKHTNKSFFLSLEIENDQNDHLQFTIFVGNFVDTKQRIFRDLNDFFYEMYR